MSPCRYGARGVDARPRCGTAAERRRVRGAHLAPACLQRWPAGEPSAGHVPWTRTPHPSRGVRVDVPGLPAPLRGRLRLHRQLPVIPGRFAGRGHDRCDNAVPDRVIHPLTAPLVREIIPRRRPRVGDGEVRPALALLENVIELHRVRSLRCSPRISGYPDEIVARRGPTT